MIIQVQVRKRLRVGASKTPRLSKPSGKKITYGGMLPRRVRVGEPELWNYRHEKEFIKRKEEEEKRIGHSEHEK
jgi:hypothetical protein